MKRPAVIAPVTLRACALVSAAGHGLEALAQALRTSRGALRPNDLSFGDAPALAGWIGTVPGADGVALPAALALPAGPWPGRAVALAWLGLQADGFAGALQDAIARHGAHRVGLVLGTSASTIAVSEAAYRAPAADGGFPPPLREPRFNTLHALADFVQVATGLQGPCLTVSTACSSSAKAFATGERWLRLGLADAVVVGGVDALGASLLHGFHALGLVSPEPCRPFDAARRGVSLGEAAGYALLERGRGEVELLGWGESNDAHHMSSPHPQGLGAEQALADALARAGLAADAVDHVNLHGTASARNDEVEAALVARAYPARTRCSATKGLTGHTMGAAGIVEALACVVALREGFVPGSAGTAAADPALGEAFGERLQLAPAAADPRIAVSHSFGFGGNNAVLVFGRGDRV
ncbi:MAG: beta-ketoacyl-ACP synthase [Rubrivivax sp.]|nr:beta-ketoacyl-ACP synthase [Rubrivivax sp.]